MRFTLLCGLLLTAAMPGCIDRQKNSAALTANDPNFKTYDAAQKPGHEGELGCVCVADSGSQWTLYRYHRTPAEAYRVKLASGDLDSCVRAKSKPEGPNQTICAFKF